MLKSKFRKKLLAALVLLLFFSGSANAFWMDKFADPINGEFKSFVKEAGAMTAYRGVAPAKSLGSSGFSLGISVNFLELDTKYWSNILKAIEKEYKWKWISILKNTDKYDPDLEAVYTFSIRKGLPYGFDIAASYTKVPNTDIYLIGGELQLQVVKEKDIIPAVAIRAGFSKLYGIKDFDIKVYSLDLVSSKEFKPITPYIGVGVFKAKGKYAGDNDFYTRVLKDQEVTQGRAFVGLEATVFKNVKAMLEAEYNDQTPIYTTKITVNW